MGQWENELKRVMAVMTVFEVWIIVGSPLLLIASYPSSLTLE